MTISRRKFTQTAALVIVGTGCAAAAGNALSQTLRSGGLFTVSGESMASPVMYFTKDTFSPFLGTIFQPLLDGPLYGRRKNPLRLVEIVAHNEDLKRAVKTGANSFSLYFQSIGQNTGPRRLEQMSYTFEHGSLGTFSLFIAPVDRAKKTYEAVISHA